jgi:hypothetical protein
MFTLDNVINPKDLTGRRRLSEDTYGTAEDPSPK